MTTATQLKLKGVAEIPPANLLFLEFGGALGIRAMLMCWSRLRT